MNKLFPVRIKSSHPWNSEQGYIFYTHVPLNSEGCMPTMCGGSLVISWHTEITVLGNVRVIVFYEKTNNLQVVPPTGSETNLKTRSLRCSSLFVMH